MSARPHSPVVLAVEGLLAALAPLPPAFVLLGRERIGEGAFWFALTAAWVAVSLLVAYDWCLSRHRYVARLVGAAALAALLLAAAPFARDSASASLALFVAAAFGFFRLLPRRAVHPSDEHLRSASRAAERARWAAGAAAAICLAELLYVRTPSASVALLISLSGFVAGALGIRWVTRVPRGEWTRRHYVIGAAALAGPVVGLAVGRLVALTAALIVALVVLLLTPSTSRVAREVGFWWQPVVHHPARLLLTTFFGLCVLGTALLGTPAASTTREPIGPVDAAFTSVSAVCVTGLIVLDTPRDFSFFGEACILLLIQVGGLGIMSIYAIAQQVLGRRLSMRQERVLEAISDTSAGDTLTSIRRVIVFTAVAEGLGAAALLPLFLAAGDGLAMAAWRALFTAISAFCNAGFALQSDSLIPYQDRPLILGVVALLIVLGGLAPAVSICIPDWLRGRRVPAAARLVLQTTVILLFAGTVGFLMLEWNGALAGLSPLGRFHNAWFQSVTLRTAGFNSLELADVRTPTLLVMILMMFIGGSPGGTAGGVKTTTCALLVMTIWTVVRGRQEVITVGRWIRPIVIYRAIAVVGAGAMVWLAILLSLGVTQDIGARELVFETTSALGTVGLTLGATAQLDQVGKVVVIVAMFLGRVGPVTLLMLLSGEPRPDPIRRPEMQVAVG